MGLPISNRYSSYAHAKLYLRVTMIFPDPLSLVFPASLSSPKKFTDWYTRKFMIK